MNSKIDALQESLTSKEPLASKPIEPVIENKAENKAVPVANPEAAPVVEVVKAPEEMTYEERVQKNIETGHDKIQLHKEMLDRYGNKLSVEVMAAMIEQIEARTRAKIAKSDSGYDPNQYAKVIRTDVFELADDMVRAKDSMAAKKAKEDNEDHFLAMAEFGTKNMHKKEEALKWYSEKMGLPLEVLNLDTPDKKAAIYAAYNNGGAPVNHRSAAAQFIDGPKSYLRDMFTKK